ncbi:MULTISPECIES: acyl-CoA dehydrogenase family protein [Xenorhabdus]|uniref:acyl-CoA dehydrogenase family protein n=2 Tax=Morganellaceae TaxID=1903414 RepID=UPI000648378F|nr:acyl-CoA dehydrogenase family protein [Xenorhabdus indica]MBC8945928.1 putative acyl-CoA dehydrogenase [Xenorhabdus indica]
MMGHELHYLVEAAKQFSDNVLRPAATLIDKQGKVPGEIITEMGAQGFLGAMLPKEYGGQGMDPLSYGYLTEEIGKGCNSTRALLTVHTSLVGETLAKLGSQSQKEKYLPPMAKGEKIACFALSEPEAGSDANAIKTKYEVTEDGFRINGSKKWITYSGIADLFLVFARCEEKVSAFIVEFGVKGLTRKPMLDLMASRGAYLSELYFDNVEIPKESLVGREGEGFSFVANTALYFGRYSIAWAGVAIAHAALEEMVTYARKRQQFGQKIAQHQLIQGIIADSATAFYAAKATCEKIGYLRNQGDHKAIMETNIAKYNSSAVAMLVANNAVQVLGGNGLSSRYPVERLYREAKVLEIIEGTNQIQQMIISQHALRSFYRKNSIIE